MMKYLSKVIAFSGALQGYVSFYFKENKKDSFLEGYFYPKQPA